MKTNQIVLVVACVLVDSGNNVLLTCRPAGKTMAGLWEFPGGKVKPSEIPEEALARELHEELGIVVQTYHLRPLTFASHSYEDFHLLMPLYICWQFAGRLIEREGQAFEWIAVNDLINCPMPEANIALIPAVFTALDSCR